MRKIILTRALVRFGGKYLLLRKAKDDFLPENIGRWECPGGKIHEGKMPAQEVLREVEEETGLKCKIIKELPFVSMKTNEIDSNCFIFLLEAPSRKIKLSNEHSEFKWVRASDVKNFELVRFASLLLEYFNNEESYLR
jgi:8-oxo-dGTP diphosphatase